MGTDSPERKAVAEAYSSESWAYKVRHMSDAQVVAIYKRLKSQGKIK